MSIFSKTGLIADITNNIYTNVQRLIKGNTLKARLLNIVDSTLIRVVDTAANFASNNPILANGEIGIESDSLSTSPKFKIGDGSTSWNSLPYANSGSSNVNYIADTAANLAANNPVMPDGYFGIESDTLLTSPKFKIAASSTAWNSLPYANVKTLAQILSQGNTISTGQIITNSSGYFILAHDTNAVADSMPQASLLWFEPSMGALYSGFRANGYHSIIRFTPTTGVSYYAGYIEFTSDGGLEIQNDGVTIFKSPNVKIIQSDDITELLNVDRANDIFSVAATINLLSKLGVSTLNINDSVASLYFDNGIKVGNVSADSSSTTISHTDLVNIDAASVKKNGVEIATENYIDNLIAGLKFKIDVVAASTANVNISSAPSSIDGVTLVNGDRVLLKNQTTSSQNGCYIFNGVGSVMTRATDSDTGAKLVSATYPVRGGTVNQDTWFTVTNDSITIGSTNIVISQTAGSGTYTVGSYLKLLGNVFDIDFTTFSTSQISEGTNKYLSNSNLATVNHAATTKTTIVDADEVTGGDSANSFSLFKTTWSNIMVYIKSKLFSKVNGGNTNYSIVDSDKIIYTGTAFTAPRTYTLPSATSINGPKTIADFLGTITSTNTLTIGVQTGEYLNGVLNGIEVIQSAYGQRVLYPDGVNNWSFDAGIVRQTKTQTLTNKTIQKRILVVTQSATPTTNIDNGDIVSITGLAQAITSMSSGLSGTPYDGQMIMWQITDNGTARAITWGASFASTTNFTLPTTTVISTMLRVLTQWNAVTSKHECIG